MADLEGSLYAGKKSKNGTHSNGGTSDWCRNRSSLSRTSAAASDQATPPQHRWPQIQTLPIQIKVAVALPSIIFLAALSNAHTQAQIVSITVEQGQGFFDWRMIIISRMLMQDSLLGVSAVAILAMVVGSQ